MTPSEILAKAVKDLEDHQRSLDTSIKAKQVQFKELSLAVELEDIRTKQELAALKKSVEEKKAALEASCAPYLAKVANLEHQVELLTQKADVFEREHQSNVAEKRKELSEMQAAMAAAQKRAEAAAAYVTDFKTKAAGL